MTTIKKKKATKAKAKVKAKKKVVAKKSTTKKKVVKKAVKTKAKTKAKKKITMADLDRLREAKNDAYKSYQATGMNPGESHKSKYLAQKKYEDAAKAHKDALNAYSNQGEPTPEKKKGFFARLRGEAAPKKEEAKPKEVKTKKGVPEEATPRRSNPKVPGCRGSCASKAEHAFWHRKGKC